VHKSISIFNAINFIHALERDGRAVDVPLEFSYVTDLEVLGIRNVLRQMMECVAEMLAEQVTTKTLISMIWTVESGIDASITHTPGLIIEPASSTSDDTKLFYVQLCVNIDTDAYLDWADEVERISDAIHNRESQCKDKIAIASQYVQDNPTQLFNCDAAIARLERKIAAEKRLAN